MSFKMQINQVRRTIMRSLTGSIGKDTFKNSNKNPNHQFNRILVSRPNQRLGNTLLLTPLIQELEKEFPNAKVDVFVKGKVAPIIFQNYKNVDEIIELPKKPFKELIAYIKVWFKIKAKNYDLVINVEKGSSSGRLSTKFANSKYKLFGEEFVTDETINEQVHFAKNPVFQVRQFLQWFDGKARTDEYPNQNIALSSDEIQLGKQQLKNFGFDLTKQTLGIFTYATGQKCYCGEWWSEFYNQFYPQFSDQYNLIEILPVEDISMLNRRLPTYYSKDVREIAAVMQNCELVLAADSGMMHLSSAAPTKTLGLFRFDNFDKYYPFGKGNGYVFAYDGNQNEVIEKMKALLNE